MTLSARQNLTPHSVQTTELVAFQNPSLYPLITAADMLTVLVQQHEMIVVCRPLLLAV